MDQGDVILNEILQDALDDAEEKTEVARATPMSSVDEDDEEPKPKKEADNHTQWAIGGNGRFMPVGATVEKLPAGIYEPFAQPGMWGLELLKISSDGIYLLPDMATETVLAEVTKFWNSEKKYREHNLLYKRGIILCGPPGGGKTVAVKLLMNQLVSKDGVVIIAHNINLTIMCLKAIRRIEPKRNLIVVLEDIDEIISFNGESQVLSMLDGEQNVDNILHLATTNYAEKLGARIVNRPSRFDRRVNVPMPEEAARRVYLDKATKGELARDTLETWTEDTDGLSIAHLKELVASVYCLEQPYQDVISRLKAMAVKIKPDKEFETQDVGFNSRGPKVQPKGLR